MAVTIWRWQCPVCGAGYQSLWFTTGGVQCTLHGVMTRLPPEHGDLIDCGYFSLQIIIDLGDLT
jgi:hypothetical protein